MACGGARISEEGTSLLACYMYEVMGEVWMRCNRRLRTINPVAGGGESGFWLRVKCVQVEVVDPEFH